MPNSYVEYSSGLTETTYSIPFNYIAIDDVAVKGFDGSNWSDLTVASRDASAKTVTLDVAPSAYQKIRVWRNTSTAQLVDFQNGSRLSERDLDTAYQQGLFVAQEVSENASTGALAKGEQGDQGIQGPAGTDGADPYNSNGDFDSFKVTGTNPYVYVEGDGSSYYPYMRVTGLHGGLALGTYFGGNISGDTVSFRTGSNSPDSGTEHFRIAANGDLTATDTSIASNSDERLKENIANYTYDIDKFKQYEPKTFDWKNPDAHNGKTGNRGFIAQAVKAIDDRWTGEANVTEENPDYGLIPDNVSLTSKLGEKDAMYVSVIQQLIAKIEDLETRVTALES